jgi:hypothetical protein
MSGEDTPDFARQHLLEGFFRRREEAGRFYCATCLVAQLRQRGSRAFSLASVQGAVNDAFKRPGQLQLKLVGTCEACQKPRPCIGAARPEL